mgnify:CR=1 FL=1
MTESIRLWCEQFNSAFLFCIGLLQNTLHSNTEEAISISNCKELASLKIMYAYEMEKHYYFGMESKL